jgi:predicted MPP superfamily phosphohydrolase
VVFRSSVVMTLIVSAFMSLTWRPARRPAALAMFWGLALLVHAEWLLIPRPEDLAPIERWIVILWLASMLAATVLVIPFGLLTYWWRRPGRPLSEGWLAATYAACAGASGVILACTSTAPFVIRSEEIRIPGLPAGLDGFRIANLGDVHIGAFIDAKALRAGIDAINAQPVDLLVISGDLVDDVSQLEEAMRALEASNAPRKTIAVLGNHEEMGDLAAIRDIYRRHAEHITLLVNENTALIHHGETLHVAGVDFPMLRPGTHQESRREEDAAMRERADKAFSGLEKGETIIAVAHNPRFFPVAASKGAQLTLASHTHGAQLQLFGHPVIPLYRYLQGVYRQDDTFLDVSAGFGHWLPIRFGVPREIVIDTLRSQ